MFDTGLAFPLHAGYSYLEMCPQALLLGLALHMIWTAVGEASGLEAPNPLQTFVVVSRAEVEQSCSTSCLHGQQSAGRDGTCLKLLSDLRIPFSPSKPFSKRGTSTWGLLLSLSPSLCFPFKSSPGLACEDHASTDTTTSPGQTAERTELRRLPKECRSCCPQIRMDLRAGLFQS